MSKLGLSLPTTTVPLCTNLGLVAEHEKYVLQLAKLERENTTDDARENSPQTPIVTKIRELEAEMESSTLTFTLQALPKKIFAEIEASHPPVEDDKSDATYGIHMKTGPDALLSHTSPPTILSVKGPTGEEIDFTGADWNAEADGMSNAQWSLFALAVLGLNRGVASVPFSRAASRETRRSEKK